MPGHEAGVGRRFNVRIRRQRRTIRAIDGIVRRSQQRRHWIEFHPRPAVVVPRRRDGLVVSAHREPVRFETMICPTGFEQRHRS